MSYERCGVGRHRGVVDEVERAKNRTKSKVRARVEHSIGVIKRVFGFAKVRYRGLTKNTHRLLVTCTLANLVYGAPPSIALPLPLTVADAADLTPNNETPTLSLAAAIL